MARNIFTPAEHIWNDKRYFTPPPLQQEHLFFNECLEISYSNMNLMVPK